ncbi:MAG: type III secretion system outer membrane ring subunit SctC [Pseudomonadota bacterium]
MRDGLCRLNDLLQILANASRKIFLGLLLLTLVYRSQALATEIPWLNQDAIKVTVKNQSLPDLLRVLSAENRIPIVISEAVKGNVTGKFSQTPSSLFNALTGSFGLAWFYDGHILYVYSQTEVNTRTLPLAADKFLQMQKLLRTLAIDEQRFSIIWLPAENALRLSGPPRFIEQVEELVQLVENGAIRPNAPAEVRIFRLQHAWAKDIVNQVDSREVTLPGIATLLRQLLIEAPGTKTRDTTAHSAAATVDPMKPFSGGLEAANRNPYQNALVHTPANKVERNVDRTRAVNDVSIEADPRINAVVVRGSLEKIALCEKLIKDLDTPAQLVEIEASVIDIDVDSAEEFGVSARLTSRGHFDAGIGNAIPLSNDAAANALQSIGTASVGGMLGAIVLGNNRHFFSATLNAFVRNGHARVVARPRVLTLDNTEAVLQNQQTFFVRVPGTYSTNLYQIAAGLVMRVTPQISEQNGIQRIRLLVNIEDGTVSNERVDQIPVINRKSVNTQAVIDKGDSVLVGGYIVEETMHGAQKVPLLGDIPLVGALFRQKSDHTRRAERMFLITPRLVARSAS